MNKLSGSMAVLLGSLGVMLLTIACLPTGSTPEMAIQAAISRSQQVANFQSRQTMSWEDGQIVQYTFSSVDPQGKLWECSGVTFVRSGPFGWQSESGGQSCQDANTESGTFELVGSTGGGGTDRLDWQVTSGLSQTRTPPRSRSPGMIARPQRSSWSTRLL